MPRKPVIHSSEYCYHVTNRSNNREHFYLPLEIVYDIFVNELIKLKIEEEIIVYAFVLMNNHYHLLLRTPKANISKVMYWLGRRVTKEMQQQSGRINKIFGGRYKSCIIMDEQYERTVFRYIIQNPVRAGVTDSIFKYQFCSSIFSNDNLSEELPSLSFVQYGKGSVISYLESLPLGSFRERIRRAISKTIYKDHVDRTTRRVRRSYGL